MYGAYLLTPNNELVVMSHDIIRITNMEADISRSAQMLANSRIEEQIKS